MAGDVDDHVIFPVEGVFEEFCEVAVIDSEDFKHIAGESFDVGFCAVDMVCFTELFCEAYLVFEIGVAVRVHPLYVEWAYVGDVFRVRSSGYFFDGDDFKEDILFADLVIIARAVHERDVFKSFFEEFFELL